MIKNLVVTALLLGSIAVAENLNIKPGLWEMTMTMNTSGAPPIPAEQRAEMEKRMAQMPPEMRAKMEAAIKNAQTNLAKPHLKKSCITKEDLSKPLDFEGGRGDGECKRTVVKASSTVQEIRVDCVKNGQKSTGTLKIVAASPESWSGSMEGNVSDTGGATQVVSKMSGKWLGSDCGNVQPSKR